METALNQSNISPCTRLTQVKISVSPEIAASFKAACAASNVSMVAELSRFMVDYANGSVVGKVAPNYSTRRHRRTAIKRVIKVLEHIKVCEESVRDNTPDNLYGSSSYDATEEAISLLDEAIENLLEF
jgi:adenylylsulfate kinase-like enzyme